MLSSIPLTIDGQSQTQLKQQMWLTCRERSSLELSEADRYEANRIDLDTLLVISAKAVEMGKKKKPNWYMSDSMSMPRVAY